MSTKTQNSNILKKIESISNGIDSALNRMDDFLNHNYTVQNKNLSNSKLDYESIIYNISNNIKPEDYQVLNIDRNSVVLYFKTAKRCSYIFENCNTEFDYYVIEGGLIIDVYTDISKHDTFELSNSMSLFIPTTKSHTVTIQEETKVILVLK